MKCLLLSLSIILSGCSTTENTYTSGYYVPYYINLFIEECREGRMFLVNVDGVIDMGSDCE
jgi:uncharacterized protein YceK